jgi:hypothetical protein
MVLEPLLPEFVSVGAGMFNELRKRGARPICLGAIASLVTGCQAPVALFGPDREPSYRDIVVQYLRTTLRDAPPDRTVAISHPETISSFWGKSWRVCLQVAVDNRRIGEVGASELDVLEIRDDRVSERRRAAPDDRCEAEVYEPLRF